MFKRIHRLLMHSEWKISLWYALFGTGGIVSSFGISAWAAAASAWLDTYGPIAWVAAGFAGALAFTTVWGEPLLPKPRQQAQHRMRKPRHLPSHSPFHPLEQLPYAEPGEHG